MIVFLPQLCFWTALPVFCYRIVLQEPIISAKIPQVGVPVWPANQSDCGLQWTKLNYTNHSSSTLEMGTEAFLDNQDLWACDLSPATSAVPTSHPHIVALPSTHINTSTAHARSTVRPLLPLWAYQSQLPVLFKLAFYIGGLSSESLNCERDGKRKQAVYPHGTVSPMLSCPVKSESETDGAAPEVRSCHRSAHAGTRSSCALFPFTW